MVGKRESEREREREREGVWVRESERDREIERERADQAGESFVYFIVKVTRVYGSQK